MRAILRWILLVLVVSTRASAQGDVPRVEPAACAAPAANTLSIDVECGVLLTYEDYDSPDPGDLVRLPYIVLRTPNVEKSPVPLMYPTNGGPGFSTLFNGTVNAFAGSPLLDGRDIILIEQRGLMTATPNLDCPEIERAVISNFTTADPLTEEYAREAAAAQVCRDRLVSDGVNLAAYNTPFSAKDIAAFRQALGIEQWDILGVSYGTNYAAAILREDPEGVRRVVLDSVALRPGDRLDAGSANLERALDAMYVACAAQPQCAATYPTLQADFEALMARMAANPLVIDVADPISGEPATFRLTGADLSLGIFNALYDPSVIPYLPLVIKSIEAGNTDVAVPLAENGFISVVDQDTGMQLSADCQETIPFVTRPASYEKPADGASIIDRFDPFGSAFKLCDVWGLPVADPAINEYVIVDVPVLVLAGGFDPITPPADSEAWADALPNAHYLFFPELGHAVNGWSCVPHIIARFLDSPDGVPAAACDDDFAVNFVVPADVYLTPFPYRLYGDVVNSRAPLLTALLVNTAVLAFVQLAIGAWTLLGRRPTLPQARIAQMIALVWAASFVLFAVVFGAALASSDFVMLGFGLPASAGGLVATAGWLHVFSAAIFAFFAGISVRRQWWSAVRHGVFALSAVFASLFAAWILVGRLLI